MSCRTLLSPTRSCREPNPLSSWAPLRRLKFRGTSLDSPFMTSQNGVR